MLTSKKRAGVMTHFIRFLFLSICFFPLLFSTPSVGETVWVFRLQGAINPTSTAYIERMITDAGEQGVHCLVMELDTPGGLVTSTRQITRAMMASPVPLVVYVAPAGAHAGSAGVFITMAAHVAAMAPGTNIGAASVVNLGGAPADSNQATLMRKMTNDAVAFIRSISEERGRNADWAEKAVREAVSVTANEALDLNVIDVLAPSVDSLLAAIDGRTVDVNGRDMTLTTRDAQVVRMEMPWRIQFLMRITDPSVAYILMTLGMLGLLFELQAPGAIFPGVLGGICILLAFYAMNSLPVNYAGMGLILLAIIFFLLEIKIPSYGALTIGGVISFVLGSVLLFDSDLPFLRLSWEVILAVTATVTAFFVFAVGMGIRAQRRKPATGSEYLVGVSAVSLESFRDGRGQVSCEGEIWNAVSSAAIRKGDALTITRVEGLTLHVMPDSR